MLQGFYTAASGMFMQQRSLNTISNNLANTQTPGYRSKRLLSSTFEQTLLTRLEYDQYHYLGQGSPVRIVSEVVDMFNHGGLSETGRPFDLGMEQYGFFNIQGEDGQIYLTRDGQFDLDDEGYLILRDRGRVMGTGGPLQLGTSDIEVDEDGNITNSVTGAELGRLQITMPAEDATLEEVRTGLYQVTAGAVGEAENPLVHQGYLENSNVNMTDEMTALIMAQRNYATAAQALQFIDATYAKAVNIAAV